ncbi:MAG: hypothetical protein ACLP9L_24880 [Thermoguttaceae bacterium]
MSLSSLLQLIPPLAVYRRIPLDPRLNALGPWQEATEKLFTPDDDNGIREILVCATQMPTSRILLAHAKFAQEVLRQNAACLDALDRGLERGQLQFSEFRSLEQAPVDTAFVTRLGEVARLHLIRFCVWLSEGDIVSAAEEIFRVEKIGSMICNGEGQMLHYLIGLWLRAAAVRGFGRLAASIQTPRAVLERILQALDDGLKAPDGLAQSLRVDLCTIALAQLDRTLEDPDLNKVVGKLLEVYYVPRRNPMAKIRCPELAAITDGWLEERRQQILLLLGNHPKPFDQAATARLMGVIVAETIRDLNQSRWPVFLDVIGRLHSIRRKIRLFRLARKTQFWPVELSPGVQIDTAGGRSTRLPKDGKITTVQLPTGNLTEARLAALQTKLKRFDNPIGLMLVEHLMAYDYGPQLLEHFGMMKTMRGLIRQRLAAA